MGRSARSFTDGTARAGRLFALGLVAFLLVAVPIGICVGGVLHAVTSGGEIVGSILDLSVFLPSLILFGLPGIGIYTLVLSTGRSDRPLSTVAIVAALPLIGTGWVGGYHIFMFRSLALSGTMLAAMFAFGLMLIGPFRRHLL